MEECLYFSYRVFQLMEKVFMEAPEKQRKKNHLFFPDPSKMATC